MRPPSASRPDLVVLGGGIAGLTTALAAARRGLRVTVVDRPRAGAASRASAGMLAPSVEGLPADVHSAALEARDIYPDFLSGLAELTSIEVALNREGILELAEDDAQFVAHSRTLPARASLLNDAELAALEPSLAGRPGAVLHPGDGAVDNVRLMDALEAAVGATSSITRVIADVERADLEVADPALVTADGSRIAGAKLVLAGGAWAATLPGLPRPLPVRPIRGQLMLLEADTLGHVTYGGGGYLVPRGGRLLVGATSEDVGFAHEISPDGRAMLIDIAARSVASLRNATVLEHWSGLRPMSPDGLPIVGQDPDRPALFYSCGYSRNGILFAPWCAEQLGEAIIGLEAPPEVGVFSIRRAGLREQAR